MQRQLQKRTMKAKVVLLTLTAAAISTPLKGSPNLSRRYLPEENDPFRIKYLLREDDNGQMYFEDLTQPIPEIRVSEKDLKLYLHTRENAEKGVPLQIGNLNDLKQSKLFDPKKPNYFIAHGLNNDYKSNVNVVLKQAILTVSDANVFVADWSNPANSFYLTAFGAVPHIGKYMGNFINEMINEFGLTPKMFRLVGHSLGAHVAGCAGAQVNGLVDYIIGMDPAGPLFTLGNIENRLDESDAEFVHVIHTSDSLLGFGSAIGHADYFPNGGSSQPGCGIDIIGTCAHSRAYYYFEESILVGGFNAKKCQSYRSYKSRKCDDNDSSFLGNLDVDKSASGDYYLSTNKSPPFSLQ